MDSKKNSAVDIERLSAKYKIKPEDLNNLLREWSLYLFYAKEYSDYPDEEKGSELSTVELASLSLFYYENKTKIDADNISLLDKAKFTPHHPADQPLKLSGYYASKIINHYLRYMKEGKRLFSEELAEKILEQKRKPGKGKESSKVGRDELVKMAASYLKLEGYNNYASLIKELLSKMGIAEIGIGTVRQIIHRS